MFIIRCLFDNRLFLERLHLLLYTLYLKLIIIHLKGMGLFASYSISSLVLIALSAFIIGLSKAGLKGIDMLNVTIMTIVFGGKASTGIVLPLLCAADILAVKYYHRHAQWPHFWKLIPWMAAGILIGVFIGKD